MTRDRKEVEAEWLGHDFLLVDTGGWMTGGDALDKKVSSQSEQAIKDAEVILFVVDATVGVTQEDSEVADLLRRVDAPGASWSPTRSTTPARGLDLGAAGPRRRRPAPDLGAARPQHRRPARRGRSATCPSRRGRRGRGPSRHRRRHHLGRARRPPERRQVHAVQPADRRGPCRGARHAGHHPRQRRHRGRDRGRSAALRRHRRHAPQVPHRREHRVLLDGPVAQGGRHRRTSRCS